MAEPALKRILIVDDDVSMLRVMREAITSFLKCEVDTTPNPEYAFELMLKKRFDLLIFDFSMPHIDGATLFLLINKVYANVKPPRVVPPLVLVSARAQEARVRELVKEAGVHGLIAKPFSVNGLIEKVKECLPSIPPAAA